MSYIKIMDKDHLVELITSSLSQGSNKYYSEKSFEALKEYLERLNLDQLKTMSKEFIL